MFKNTQIGGNIMSKSLKQRMADLEAQIQRQPQIINITVSSPRSIDEVEADLKKILCRLGYKL